MTMQTKLCVVGGGPGGYAAAFLAADLGLDVTLIEARKTAGGTCLFEGCIPSKALLHLAGLVSETKAVSACGMTFSQPHIDVDKVRAWKQSIVEKLSNGLAQLTKQRKIKTMQGLAKLQNTHTLLVETANGQAETISFEHAILCTGSLPILLPNLPQNSTRIWNSTHALNLEHVPKRLLVIGGGYIGLELGSVYAGLGSQVTVAEMLPSLLPGADKDLVRPLSRRLSHIFENIFVQTRVENLEDTGSSVRVFFKGDGIENPQQEFDAVLVSVGRKPNSQHLGLEETNIELDETGFVQVDKQCRTKEPHIFAIGDLVGQPMLAHKASHEGLVAAQVIAGKKAEFAPRAIPAVVFTDPELAWCGLTETQAKESGHQHEVARFPWLASGRAMTLERTEGMTKLIVDPDSQKILGVGIVGPHAGDLISEGVLAVEQECTAKDLKNCIHPHPTLSETMMEAAEVFFGQSTHIYKPKRK